MERTISATELKNALGAVLRDVRNDEEIVVVEQRGVPAAAIISIDYFPCCERRKEQQRRARLLEEFRQLRASLSERQRGMAPEEAERLQRIRRCGHGCRIETARSRFEERSRREGMLDTMCSSAYCSPSSSRRRRWSNSSMPRFAEGMCCSCRKRYWQKWKAPGQGSHFCGTLFRPNS